MHNHKSDPDATLSIAVMVIPLSGTIQTIAGPIGALLLKRLHPKIIIVLAASIMTFAVLGASLMKTWWTFVIFWAIMFPFGIGMMYYVPIICGWEWFPNRKGLISGIIIGGFGFGAFIFGFVTTAIANPNNLKVAVPDDGTGTTDKLFPVEVAKNVP